MSHSRIWIAILITFTHLALNASSVPSSHSTALSDWLLPQQSADHQHQIGITDGPIQTAILETERSVEQIWNFYAKKVGTQYRFAPKKLIIDQGQTGSGRYLIKETFKGTNRQALFVYTCQEFTLNASIRPAASVTTIEITFVSHSPNYRAE